MRSRSPQPHASTQSISINDQQYAISQLHHVCIRNRLRRAYATLAIIQRTITFIIPQHQHIEKRMREQHGPPARRLQTRCKAYVADTNNKHAQTHTPTRTSYESARSNAQLSLCARTTTVTVQRPANACTHASPQGMSCPHIAYTSLSLYQLCCVSETSFRIICTGT